MEQKTFAQKLSQVALAYDTTTEGIYKKIALAMEEGRQSRDPQVRALWNSISRSGGNLTLEDFVEYLAQTLEQPYDP